MYGKNCFTEVSKNLASYRYEIFVCLQIWNNYFDDPTKLFSDLYLIKFLDTL